MDDGAEDAAADGAEESAAADKKLEVRHTLWAWFWAWTWTLAWAWAWFCSDRTHSLVLAAVLQKGSMKTRF